MSDTRTGSMSMVEAVVPAERVLILDLDKGFG